MTTSWRLDYTAALEAWDPEAIVSRLAGDVTIRVAVHDAPMHGREVARFLFGVLAEELATPRVTDEIVEGAKAVVRFDTGIGERSAQGLNVLEHDDTGAVRELTVFFRPLEALQAIAEVVGGRMAARFGPLP